MGQSIIQCWLLIYSLPATQPIIEKNPQLLEKCCTTPLSGILQPGLSNDFENKTLIPWVDASEDGTFWTIGSFSVGNINAKSNFISPPPTNDGKYFIYLTNAFDQFGVGILQTESFVALPGDQLGFSYWIYSALPQFNNIQVDFITIRKFACIKKKQERTKSKYHNIFL